MSEREYLEQYLILRTRIKELELEIEVQKEIAESLNGWSDGDRVQSTREPDKIGRAVAKLADMEAECSDMIIDSVDKMEEITSRIRTLKNPEEALVIEYRYIQGLQWETIRQKMYCSREWAMALRNRACDELDRRYEDDW